MDTEHLSKRLQRLADWVPVGSRVLDIGSDHAYLPIHLVATGQATRAIAGEVIEGPYRRSQRAVLSAGMADQIDVRLGDGFDVVAAGDVIDVVTIAGMGGELITNILTRGLEQKRLPEGATLLLQPNRDLPLVRQWLNTHHYTILDEAIVRDGKRWYEMIQSRQTDAFVPLTATELCFGRYTERSNPDVFRAKWMHEYHKVDRVIQTMERLNSTHHLAAKQARRDAIARRLGVQ